MKLPRVRFLTIFAAISITVALTACGGIDPKVKMLEPYVEANPFPTAIEGMWHWRNLSGVGAGGSHSLLFTKEGTVYWKSKQGIGGDVDVPMLKAGYKYIGNGVWTTEHQPFPRLRLAKGHLISYGPFGPWGAFERQ